MCQSCVDVSETVAKVFPCQSYAVSSGQARSLRLRLVVIFSAALIGKAVAKG